MNFSDDWRSLWPVAAVFPVPNLLSGDTSSTFGPLLFRPSSPRRCLLASSALALCVPPALSSSVTDSIRTFFRCVQNESFLSSASQDFLAADVLSSFADASGDPADSLARNNLHSITCRDGSSMLLFFPTGDNADEIGFVLLRFKGDSLSPEVVVDVDGDIFKQKEGMKHRRHRILKMSVASAPAYSSSQTGDPITEGYLIATTLYSVNWFRIETRVSERGMERILLVPLANQGFSSCVVDACWSPHFPEESAVLLETGELFWFNLFTKKGGFTRVSLGGKSDPGRWLGCRFGGQPWVLLVACSVAVVMVDLRPRLITEQPKVLARIRLPNSLGVVSMDEKNDNFRAFSRADFSDFHFSVVTGRLLLLFDIRQPLVPLLIWDHGLQQPSYVAMFRLSELRSSVEFNCASESGFVIIVGSFWNNEFKLFCCGPDREASERSLFYAWELPSSLSLSGRTWGSADELLREMMFKEELPNRLELLQRKEGVAGFCIVPNVLLKTEQEPGGFLLVRLMLSGKLEIQGYHASFDSLQEESIFNVTDLEDAEDLVVCCIHEGGRLSNRYSFFKFEYLYEYMNGNLSKALTDCPSRSNNKEVNRDYFSDDLKKFLHSKLESSSIPVSTFISEVSIPMSIFEIAFRRVLSTLPLDIAALAFSEYKKIFTGHIETSFLPLEFPKCLPHHKFPPFFINRPLKRSEKLSNKVFHGDTIVGPLLPLPVLLAFQEIISSGGNLSNKEEGGGLLMLNCKTVWQYVFPEVSIADIGGTNGWGESQELRDEKPFWVYEPKLNACGTSFKDTESTSSFNKEVLPQTDHLSSVVTDDCPKDEKFTTFICGISDNTPCLDCGSQGADLDFIDVCPMRMDLESLDISFQHTEQKVYESLKRQATKWLENDRSYQDFCRSSKIPKSVQ
ncbi:hypothetical protein AXF42_Ash019397 [Apostasia shenzhenica]|uniref:Uncharacterized protein n=1 Tax=Apostasia shenzhenica TaxID=1088818 RepID=A0A2I0B4U0_9ASPA|nr:hypothetical protein AXF42_Ash019397 [Apostasia shenzhenica]